MAEKRSIGLKSVKFGAIEADGGMGATLTQWGVTYKGTASFTMSEPEMKEFFSEENDTPEESIVVKPSVSNFEMQLMDVQASTLEKVLGGTATAGVWNSPATILDQELSCEIETKRGFILQYPRLQITATIDWKLSSEEIAVLKIKGTILQPKKTGVSSVTIKDPVI